MIDFLVENNTSLFLKKVRKCISKGESEKAIELLIQFSSRKDIDKNACNHILLISNQFESMKHREMKGLNVSYAEKNDFTKRLLDLVNYLQENFVVESNDDFVRNVDKSNFKNMQRLGIYTGISMVTLVAILIGANIILSIIIGVLAVILFWKFDIDIS